MSLYQMTNNCPGAKCVEVGEVIEDPPHIKFRLLFVWYLLYYSLTSTLPLGAGPGIMKFFPSCPQYSFMPTESLDYPGSFA